MEKPLLSICIPTWNRAEYLEKSLNSLVNQDEFAQVEVVISDNASTDGTQSLCEKFCSQYPNIIYHRNEENIHDRNFPTVLMEARGTFRKLFNDTAVFEPDSIAYMLGLVREYEAARPLLFFLNTQRVPVRITPVTECASFPQFCRTLGHRLTWLSSFGFWEEECQGLEAEFPQCETHLWQTGKALRIMAQKKSAVILQRKILSIQTVAHKDFSYGLYTVFYKNFPALLAPYVQSGELSEGDVRFIRKDQLYTQAAPWIFRARALYKDVDFGNEADCRNLILESYRHEAYYVPFRIHCFLKYTVLERYKALLAQLKASCGRNMAGRALLQAKRRLNLKLY